MATLYNVSYGKQNVKQLKEYKQSVIFECVTEKVI